MSCGTKLEGRFYSYSERQDLADAIERDGEYSLAQRVRHGDCLSYSEMDRAERALEHEGMDRFDYNKSRCACQEEGEQETEREYERYKDWL